MAVHGWRRTVRRKAPSFVQAQAGRFVVFPIPCFFHSLCHILLHRPAAEGHGRVMRRLAWRPEGAAGVNRSGSEPPQEQTATGVARGRQEGAMEKARETAVQLARMGMEDVMIAKALEAELSQVKRWIQAEKVR